jgi:hypothetical protein
MKATAVGYDFIPAFTLELDNGEPLTLQEIFDAANLDIDPSYAVSYGLGAKDFGDGCGGVSLALDLVGVVGIDTDLSTVTTSAGPDGPIIEAVVNPYAAVQVVGEASAGYIGALSASITATLNLLYANFPYTAVIEAVKSDAPDFLQLRIDENLSANLTTLSGDISYSVSYWCVATCYHQGTLVDWDGFALGEWSLFNKFTALNYGSGLAPGWCTGQAGTLHQGDFDGDGLDDQLCHNHESGDRATDKAVNGFVGTDWWAPGWCIGGEIHVGDFNGDGRDDQLCVADDEWHIDHADAQGNFGSSDWATGTQWCSAATQDMYVGDFNGDGLDDLLCHDHESGYRWIDYADNGFAFSDWASYGNWCGGASQGDSFSVGDYDGDERDDLRCDNNGYHWIDYAANYFGATDYEGTELPDNQQCGSVGGWYQSPAPTPVFDGSACKVMAWPVPLYPGENTFIYANRWYVTPGEGNDCSMGNFDGANCEIGLAPAGTTAYFVDDVPYYTYNPCGSVGSWYQNPAPVPTWDGSSCSVANVPVPPGENTFIYANHWYITPGEGNSCSMGNFDGANCDIGTPPLGATASFVDGYAVYTLP